MVLFLKFECSFSRRDTRLTSLWLQFVPCKAFLCQKSEQSPHVSRFPEMQGLGLDSGYDLRFDQDIRKKSTVCKTATSTCCTLYSYISIHSVVIRPNRSTAQMVRQRSALYSASQALAVHVTFAIFCYCTQPIESTVHISRMRTVIYVL